MRRFTEKQYRWQASVVMCVYVAAMLLAWPLVRTTPGLLLKLLLLCLPVLPMLYLIALMARRIWQSDELEQRTHLIALGAATAVTGSLSLVGGFLAAGQVLHVDGSILIWGFPVLMIVYGIARWWVVTRRYGGDMSCDEDGGLPMYLRLLLLAGLMVMIALVLRWCGRLDDAGIGTLCGTAAGLLLVAGLLGLGRWRRRKA